MASSSAPPFEAETETGRLLADAQADLQRHEVALAKLQGELMASRLEVSGARGETVQFQGFLRRAEAQAAAAHAHIEELRAHAASREAEIARLHADISTLHAGMAVLRADGDALRASLSWRITSPLRRTVRLLRRQ
jgi:hypothetical protein